MQSRLQDRSVCTTSLILLRVILFWLLTFISTIVLTSEYPDGSFANIDRSLVPPNTLVVGRGWSLQNQTSLPGYVLDKFPLKVVSIFLPILNNNIYSLFESNLYMAERYRKGLA